MKNFKGVAFLLLHQPAVRLQVALHIAPTSTFPYNYHMPNLEVPTSRFRRTVNGLELSLRESFRGLDLVRLSGLLPRTALVTAVISFGACRIRGIAEPLSNTPFPLLLLTSATHSHLCTPGGPSLLGSLDQSLISAQRFQEPL